MRSSIGQIRTRTSICASRARMGYKTLKVNPDDAARLLPSDLTGE
jgi:hypothetical protein